MAAEEVAAATEETLAIVPGKEKKIAEDTSEEKDFNFQNIIGQELSKTEKKELREYAISYGYQPGALLFGGIDEESLGCLRDRTGAKIIGTLSKSICNTLNLGYKISFLIFTKFRCYPLFSLLFFSFS